MVNNMVYFFYDGFRFDLVHAGKVFAIAGLFAVDGTRPAGKIDLYDIIDVLVPSQESGIGMSSAPDADDGCVDQ